MKRSEIMRRVRSKDTGPELLVRKITFALGFRYRLHKKDLPGKPDLVFQGKKKIIFIHGCFWHGHRCKRGSRTPKTNRDYWIKKITGNIERDKRHIEELNKQGWSVLIIWECETKDTDTLKKRLKNFLDD